MGTLTFFSVDMERRKERGVVAALVMWGELHLYAYIRAGGDVVCLVYEPRGG